MQVHVILTLPHAKSAAAVTNSRWRDDIRLHNIHYYHCISFHVIFCMHVVQAGACSVQHHAGQVQESQHDQDCEAAGGVCGGQGGAGVHPLCDPAAHIARPD